MRTRILGKMLNSEVQDYLSRNDIIIVPVGTTEMHGGFPLDCETVISEAFALKMAESCDGLVLTGLPYFYAGATASGRGTVQVTVRQGIDYLGAIARSLLRLGFKRQVYISFHGPAHMTICPMVRDFYDETGVPILYLDSMINMGKCMDLFGKAGMGAFHDITVGAYKIMNRIDDIALAMTTRIPSPALLSTICLHWASRVLPLVTASAKTATIWELPIFLILRPVTAWQKAVQTSSARWWSVWICLMWWSSCVSWKPTVRRTRKSTPGCLLPGTGTTKEK